MYVAVVTESYTITKTVTYIIKFIFLLQQKTIMVTHTFHLYNQTILHYA